MIIFLDLFKFSPSFRYGSIIIFLVLFMVLLSFFSPYEPDDKRAVPRNKPPSAEFILGTTSTSFSTAKPITKADNKQSKREEKEE